MRLKYLNYRKIFLNNLSNRRKFKVRKIRKMIYLTFLTRKQMITIYYPKSHRKDKICLMKFLINLKVRKRVNKKFKKIFQKVLSQVQAPQVTSFNLILIGVTMKICYLMKNYLNYTICLTVTRTNFCK